MTRSMETVFRILCSSKVTVLVHTFKMQCGLDVRLLSLSLGLLSNASAEDSGVVAKGGSAMKT